MNIIYYKLLLADKYLSNNSFFALEPNLSFSHFKKNEPVHIYPLKYSSSL